MAIASVQNNKVSSANRPQRTFREKVASVATATPYLPETLKRHDASELSLGHSALVTATKDTTNIVASAGLATDLGLFTYRLITGAENFFTSNKFLISSALGFGVLPVLKNLFITTTPTTKTKPEEKIEDKTENVEITQAKVIENIFSKIGSNDKLQKLQDLLPKTSPALATRIKGNREFYSSIGIGIYPGGDSLYTWHNNPTLSKNFNLGEESSACLITGTGNEKKVYGIRISFAELEGKKGQEIPIEIIVKGYDEGDENFKIFGDPERPTHINFNSLSNTINLDKSAQDFIREVLSIRTLTEEENAAKAS